MTVTNQTMAGETERERKTSLFALRSVRSSSRVAQLHT